MKIVKKERLDVRKFMEQAKANKTNRSYTSIETKTRPAMESKYDQGRPMGQLYSNSMSQNNNNQPLFPSNYQDSRRGCEQSQMAIYNYVPFHTANEYGMNPTSSYVVNQSSQNFMGASPYYYMQNANPVLTQTQSFPINSISPIGQMRQSLPQYTQQNFMGGMGIVHSQVQMMGSLRKEQEINARQMDRTVTVPAHRITESIVIEMGERDEGLSKVKTGEGLSKVETGEGQTTNEKVAVEVKTEKKKAGKKKKVKVEPKEVQDQPKEVKDKLANSQIAHKLDKSTQKTPEATSFMALQTLRQNIYANFNSHLQTTLQNAISPPKYVRFQTKSAQILQKLNEVFPQPSPPFCLQSFSTQMLALLQ